MAHAPGCVASLVKTAPVSSTGSDAKPTITQIQGAYMNKFDELTKAMAQSVTRRAPVKKFGLGIAGMALACFGRTNKAAPAARQTFCQISGAFFTNDLYYTGACLDINGCGWSPSADCPANGTFAGSVRHSGKFTDACGYLYSNGKKCS